MDQFKHIDYLMSLEIFRKAEVLGRRLKLGEFRTSCWLQKENIKLDDIKSASRNFPDLRIFIIGEGEFEGFYIYSQKKESCFKFEAPVLNYK
ncbi:hypothetical protein [Mangrovibacterium diazotrophicum]|uniref:Uncharacterized protein n=1 Tax=Mangrovibacterium diazotrophicum TaxID=1261403 RepID=A0A419W520_9BACT|nr:hypothetical protein [Mangrovibacterium diazotrophicum]RKD90526.1 hypothetical protein BC643_0866 [Mangrovibacterium diazotrophicum]